MNENFSTKLLISLFVTIDDLRQVFITPCCSRALGHFRLQFLRASLPCKQGGKRKSLILSSPETVPYLRLSYLLYEKERENLKHFDISLIKVQLFCCTKALIHHEDYFYFFTWFANFTYQFLAHFLASFQNL